MMDCVAIGDSIAVGTGKELGCEIRAYIGAPSSRIVSMAHGNYRAVCVLSAGSNDPLNPKLSINLREIREKAKCSSYKWIVPINKNAAAMVKQVADSYGDETITFTPSKDNVHPLNYNEIVKKITK